LLTSLGLSLPCLLSLDTAAAQTGRHGTAGLCLLPSSSLFRHPVPSPRCFGPALLNLAASISDENSRWIQSWPSSWTLLHPITCFPCSSHCHASPPSLGNACDLWLCLCGGCIRSCMTVARVLAPPTSLSTHVRRSLIHSHMGKDQSSSIPA
jgi:hypothetical protein